MNHRTVQFGLARAFALGLLALLPSLTEASPPINPADIPGSVDAGRIKPDDELLAPLPGGESSMSFPETPSDIAIPEGAQNIKFVLRDVVVEGSTAFTPEELSQSYASYLNEEISLATAYQIAADLTRRYRNEGYFLSLVSVPDQKIDKGILTLRVTEGYVSEVDLPKDQVDYYVVDEFIARLKREKPLKSETLESFLLRLNDLPGHAFRGVLSAAEGQDGGVKLTLVPSTKPGTAMVNVDNFSSRYLGPHEATASYSTSIIPYQQTTVSFVNSYPLDRMHYGSITQTIPVYPNLNLELGVSQAKVQPGFTLEVLEIKSDSKTFDIGLDYQVIRRRQQNLTFGVKLDGRNSTSDALSVRITNDRIRALRTSVNFDTSDNWEGYNVLNLVLSQGINGLGSSKAGDFDLSRARAKPDFTKVSFDASRLQRIDEDWSVQGKASGQWASKPLYSSEEFGYGGQSFGRSYDASELIGDEGIVGALEVRYTGFASLNPIALQPYAFYDIGLITNQDVGQVKREVAASIGAGFRFSTPWDQSGSFAFALPMIRKVDTPIYGSTTSGPRFSFQVTQGF